MPQQHTTTSGTGTAAGQIGREVVLGPDAKKKELGDNKLEVEVNGTYTPDPGRANVTFRVDGKEVLNQEFGYYDEKVFTFDSTHKWAPGEHAFTLELKPVVPAGKKETIIDLFVRKVTIEGPLEKAHWVKTEK